MNNERKHPPSPELNGLAARAWAACGRKLRVRVTRRDETSVAGLIHRILNVPSEKLRRDGGSTLTLLIGPELVGAEAIHLDDVDRIDLER